eukprot:jgi/Ulvmu1/7571/UM037_0115.1
MPVLGLVYQTESLIRTHIATSGMQKSHTKESCMTQYDPSSSMHLRQQYLAGPDSLLVGDVPNLTNPHVINGIFNYTPELAPRHTYGVPAWSATGTYTSATGTNIRAMTDPAPPQVDCDISTKCVCVCSACATMARNRKQRMCAAGRTRTPHPQPFSPPSVVPVNF